MAVSKNPYGEWENLRQNSDYRSTDTQVNSLVKTQLSNPEFLRTSNRVNPGPYRNLRARVADNSDQIPHPFGSEDLWGWQEWADETASLIQQPEIADNLLEIQDTALVPGKDYLPYGEVEGASS
jgi:hypothetical protein